MKALLFDKFKNICVKTILCILGIQIVSLFLYIWTWREMAIQSCEYHIVPLPRKWGFEDRKGAKLIFCRVVTYVLDGGIACMIYICRWGSRERGEER